MFVNISSGSRSSTPSSDRITCKTVKSSNETTDSGIFSPVAGSAKIIKDPTLLPSGMLHISPLKMPLSPSKQRNESIMSEMTDISISEEWEKDFFTNFEENLFNMDIDDRVLSDILKSPKGKAAMNEIIRSPKGKAFVDKMMKSPKGKVMRHQLDCRNTDSRLQESPSFSDAKKLSATPMKPELHGMLKMSNSKRRLTMTDTSIRNEQLGTDTEIDMVIQQSIMKKSKENYKQILPKENLEPVVWPSKERLKFARAQFQKTLQMAIQKVSEDTQKKKVKFHDSVKTKSDKYPEIKQALSRPAGQVKTVKRQFPKIKPLNVDPKNLYLPFTESSENSVSLSQSYIAYDDDSDEDETWLPFSSSQKSGKNSNFQIKRRKYARSKYEM